MAAATAAGAFSKRKTCLALLVLSLAIFVLAGSGMLPRILLDKLQTRGQAINVNWKSRNWIVVLGAGSVHWPQSSAVTTSAFGYSRVYEAARLYFSCKKVSDSCRILPSGGDPSGNGVSEATSMTRELEAIGVEASDIVAETESNNTFQNAQFSSAILKAKGFDLEKQSITLPHVKTVGTYEVDVRLYSGVHAKLPIEVTALAAE